MVAYIPNFMSEPLVQGLALLDQLPHRPPIVLVDALLEATAQAAMSRFTVQDSTLFVQNGHFQPAGLLENMAQTVALSAAWRAEAQEPPSMGYLVLIKNAQIYGCPTIGTTITTHIEVQHQLGTLTVVQGRVYQGTELLAEAQLTFTQQVKEAAS